MPRLRFRCKPNALTRLSLVDENRRQRRASSTFELMDMEPELRAGYGWLVGEAKRLGGNLGGILELEPPDWSSEAWHCGFYLCRVDLIDLLYPDGEPRSLAVYAEEHRADDADAHAVALFADPECGLAISEIREAVRRASDESCSFEGDVYRSPVKGLASSRGCA